jgi:hypothetical protein
MPRYVVAKPGVRRIVHLATLLLGTAPGEQRVVPTVVGHHASCAHPRCSSASDAWRIANERPVRSSTASRSLSPAARR